MSAFPGFMSRVHFLWLKTFYENELIIFHKNIMKGMQKKTRKKWNLFGIYKETKEIGKTGNYLESNMFVSFQSYLCINEAIPTC